MRKLNSVLVLLLLSSFNLFGQTTARTTIKGVVCDTAGISVPNAMVMLLAAKDSALTNYMMADEKGTFEFRNVKNMGYLLKIQHMSFVPYQKLLSVSPSELTELGRIKLKLISKVLREVVIEAAKAPLKFYGDTIEYDATAFKVPPGSTVEDLLRRLPGVDVDVAGNIKLQGKDVKRLYVEGKTFFGSDPLFATKNLGAEIVSKVQFFDEKSEKEIFTGVKEPIHETKAMNLSLKEEFKKGGFGKVTAQVGDQDRRALRGYYNRFDKKQMLSFIGYGNNLNQTGVNWDDYGDYTGQSISGSIGVYTLGSDYMDLSMRNPFKNSFDGRGLTDNYGGGVNYNLDNSKTKISANYNYNETTRKLFQTSNKETFLQSGSFKNADTTHNLEFVGKHYLEFCIERTINKANVLSSKTYINFSPSKGNYLTTSLFTDTNNVNNQRLTRINNNNLDAWNVNSAVVFRHRFKKEGVVFIWSGGVTAIKSNGLDHPFSLNRFFEVNTFTDQVRELITNNTNKTTQFKSDMIWAKPLSKRVMLEVTYIFRATNTIQDKLTQNSAMQNIRIDSLTAYYANDNLYNRIGTNLTYNYKYLYVYARVAAQQIQITGNYSLRKETPNLIDPMHKIYYNLLPSIGLRNNLTKFTYIDVGYGEGITTPSINELMPVVNVNDPSWLIKGNANLQPSHNHSYDFAFRSQSRQSTWGFNFSMGYKETTHSISMGRSYNLIEKVGWQTVIQPENMKGIKKQTYLSISYDLRLIKSVLRMRANSSFVFGKSPTLINEIESFEKNTNNSFGTSFNFTLSQKLFLDLSGSMNFTNMKYTRGTNYDQKIRSYSANSALRWEIATNTYFESNFNFSVYKNESLGFDKNIPLLNASLRQIMGKGKRIEMRLSANDVFNKNLSISQSASELYIMSTTANNLARYFLLSLSYNLRGVVNKSE